MGKLNFIRNVIIKYLPSIIICIGFVIILVVAVVLNSSYASNLDSNLSYYEKGWIINDSGVEKNATFPIGFDFDKKEISIKNTLENVSDSDCLILEYQYQDVDCYIDGVLVFDFNNPKSGNLHTVLGTNILSIPLKEEYSGKTIELRMTPLRETKAMSIKHVYIAPPGDFLYSVYQKNIVQLVLATFLLVLGTMYLVIFITCKVKKFQFETIPSEFFLSFFSFSFFVALWIICDRHILFITTGNIVISDILAYYSFMAIPIGFVYVVYHLLRRYEKVFFCLEAAYTFNVIIQTFLFATGIVDIAFMLIVSHILMFIGIFIVVVLVTISAIKHRSTHSFIMGIAFGVFSIFMAICLVGYIFIPGFNYNSLFLVGILELILAFCYLSISEFIRVITKNHYMQQTIKYAYIDALTGIGNRRAYEDFLSEEKRKNDNANLVIIGCDVNFLKKSNDTLGHQAGDELLIATAKLLKDVFGDNVFRVGGDEFSIILNSNKEDIKLNLVALKYKVQNWSGNYNKALSLAIGYAVMGDYQGLSVEQLSVKADEQMYKIKRIMHENESMGLLFNE